MKIYEGNLTGKGINVGIVVSRFNEFFSSKLLSGALDSLKRHGVDEKNIQVCWVPGGFEIPLAAQKMAAKEEIQGVICLGAIIRGSTPHFDFVSNEVAKGIARVGLDSGKPVVFGVITTDSIEQAVERSGSKAGNKGWEAAMTALEMINLQKEF